MWPRSRPHPRRYSGSGIRKTARARRPGLRRSPRSGLALRAVGGEATGPPTVITSEPARTTSGSRAERTPCVDIHARGERPLLAWPRSHERARCWPAARGAGQSACRMGAVAYCLCRLHQEFRARDYRGSLRTLRRHTAARGPAIPHPSHTGGHRGEPRPLASLGISASPACAAKSLLLPRPGMGHPWRIVFTVLGIRSRIECEAQYHGSKSCTVFMQGTWLNLADRGAWRKGQRPGREDLCRARRAVGL